MADRQFTYKVDIDTDSARAAARATRAMFAQSISGVGGTGGQGGTASIRQMANFEINESRRVANARINDIKRVWAIEKAEAAKAMTTIQRQAAGVAGGGQQRGAGGSQLQGVLKTGFLAYGAYLATKQAVQGGVEFGRVGAQQLRMVETFKQLGDQMGVNAEDMAAAVKKATNSSISDIQAMQFSANILAQRFASNVDDIEGDTAILATASRRLAQIYTDENGELLTTEAIFSRLVKFAREGNKELVDQFGLSNELIAQTLGIPNEGLRGAEGAADRWKGMVMVMAQELERLGQPVDSTADRMERAFAKMTTALDKLRQASAEPITIAIEWAAGGVSNFATGLEGIAAIKEAQELWERSQTETSPALDMLNDSMSVLNNALATGKMGLPEYTANVMFVVDAYHKMEEGARRAAAQMEALRLNSARLVAQDFDVSPVLPEGAARFRIQQVAAGKVPIEELTEEERKFRLAIGSTKEQIEILEWMFANLAMSTEELAGVFADLIGARAALAKDIEAVKGKFEDAPKKFAEAQLGVAMAGTDTAGQIQLLIEYGKTLSDTSLEGLANQEKIASLQMRLTEESTREWKKTAKEVERLFEAAADKIMSIPGIKAPTPVTSQQLLETRFGVYKDQPDEFVRRARDELIEFYRHTDVDEYGKVTERLIPRKTTDYPDVTRERIEELAKAPPGLPGDVLLPLFEERFYSGAIFEDPKNLDLLNMDAIRGQYEEMKAGERGRKNQQEFIMKELGVSAQDAALITGQQAPIVQMLTGGLSDEEISTQLGSTLSGILDGTAGEINAKGLAKTIGDGLTGAFAPGNENYIDIAGPTLSAWNAQFGTEDIVKGLKSIGKAAALNFFSGFTNGVVDSAWGAAIISAIIASINKSLAEAAAGT